MDMNLKIGFLLRQKREACGLSLSEAGSKIGRTKSCVYYWETGRNSIDVSMLSKICAVYGVDFYDFIDELKTL